MTAGTTSADTSATADREVSASRVFDAPRDLVFDVWTKPEHVRQWYGCGTMEMPVCEIDLRVGGRYRFVLRADDGEHAFSGEFREIVRPERLVQTWCYEAIPGAEALETITFREQNGRTRVHMHTLFPSSEHKAGWSASGGEAGSEATLDRLAEVVRELADPTVAERVIVISRLFDAPPTLVYRAWTDREHVGHWWGPNGFTTTTFEMDVRPGGVWRYMMHGPDGVDYPNRMAFREVVPGERLVYDHDDDGHSDQAPFDVTTTFDEEDGKTRLTMRMRFVSPEARAAVMQFGAVELGHQTLARLGEYLPTM